MSILLVEDDERITEFLRRGLGAEGYRIRCVGNGEDALRCAESESFRLIILDLMLPGMDGREVCRRLRAARLPTPILMLTALDSTADVVRGLRFGADDYLTKPFAFEELLARIEALLRRNDAAAPPRASLTVADVVFDREALRVTRAGVEVELTSTEYALLEFLMVEAGRVVSRARILENVWGASEDPLTNVVDVYIRRLREKLDPGREVSIIKTIRGRGYRMSG